MVRWQRARVSAIRRQWRGAVEIEIVLGGSPARALAYPALVGWPEPGAEVLVNTAALDLGLGTGGYALVIAIPSHLPAGGRSAGHLVKARYTPLQAIVSGADEQESPYHEILADADDLGGVPVVIADLHSALPAVLAGFYAGRDARSGPASPGNDPDAGPGDGPDRRVVYVMLDGGALPAWFSRTIAGLREGGWLAATVTTGQAFGGDLEAVTVHSGLLTAARVLGADLIVATQGPGNLGTGTRWGFSGLACGEVVNAAAILGGRPVAALRVSQADPRPRHRGISHHSLTAYGRVALARADVVVPELPGAFGASVLNAAQALGTRHNLVRVDLSGLEQALAACPVPLSSMGRGVEEDPAYFLSAAAAGRHAADLAPAG